MLINAYAVAIQSALLMHFDGVDGSQTFTDSGPQNRTFSLVGGAATPAIDTAESVFGGSSLQCTGVGTRRITTPRTNDLLFRATDFTVECWLKLATTTGYGAVAALWGGGLYNWFCGQKAGGLVFAYYAPGPTFAELVTSSASLTSVFKHIAWVRLGGTLTIYVDGTSAASAAVGDLAEGLTTPSLCIGSDGDGSNALDGWVEELRITSGIARYTANFTPPAVPFPNS